MISSIDWRAWGSACADILYPRAELEGELIRLKRPYCEVCGDAFAMKEDAEFRCRNCVGRKWRIERARAYYRADGKVMAVIHLFKYGKQFHWLPTLAAWLEEGFDEHRAEFGQIDGLVPVPLHWWRFWTRGFNQARELAAWLGATRGIALMDCLSKNKALKHQAGLRRSQRWRIQRGAYACKRAFDVKGKSLLIIDDVFTTGATTDACAVALREAGASRVQVLTVARG